MKVVTALQMQEADRMAIPRYGMTSVELMEEAATAVWNHIQADIIGFQEVAVFCGPGNNGGDGLVLARLIEGISKQAHIFVLKSEAYSPDFQAQAGKCFDAGLQLNYIRTSAEFPRLGAAVVIVDALFGTGLTRPITGLGAELIEHINDQSAFVISVDLPSGLSADGEIFEGGAIIEADITYTIALPKLSLLLADTGRYAGKWETVRVTALNDYLTEIPDGHYEITEPAFAQFLLDDGLNAFAHKGTYGHALLIGGSQGKAGAVQLAAQGCTRSGVGLCTVLAPHSALLPLQIGVPEAMVLLTGDTEVELLCSLEPYSAVGIGPGMGMGKGATAVVDMLLSIDTKMVVWDADALNIIAREGWVSRLGDQHLITPHPGEFDRLMSLEKPSSYKRLQEAERMAAETKAVVILKGKFTAICLAEGESLVYFNATGNPGMATGGSGDVLTGFLTGLLARSGSREIAIAAVHAHGLAGDMAAQRVGERGLTAGLLARYLGRSTRHIENLINGLPF